MNERSDKQTIISFNHICYDLSEVTIKELKDLYTHYHKKAMCLKWQWKKLKRQQLILNVLSLGLTTTGTVLGAVTLNPIVLGVLSGVGVSIQGYITKRKLSAKVKNYKTAFTTYVKVLNQLKTFLRGMPYDNVMFLSDIKVIDDYITDLGLSIEEMIERYYKKFD